MSASAGARLSAIIAVVAALSTTIAFADQDRDEHGGRDAPYAIGLWGDLPYSDTQAQTGVPNLIADMNRLLSPNSSDDQRSNVLAQKVREIAPKRRG